MKIKLLLIVLLTTSLLEAKLTNEEAKRVQSETNAGSVCPNTKNYVCGKIDNEIKTFDNECKMKKEGGKSIYKGSCKTTKIFSPTKTEMNNMVEKQVKREDVYNTDLKKEVSEITEKERRKLKKIEEKKLKEKREKRERNNYRNKDLNNLKKLINSNY